MSRVTGIINDGEVYCLGCANDHKIEEEGVWFDITETDGVMGCGICHGEIETSVIHIYDEDKQKWVSYDEFYC